MVAGLIEKPDSVRAVAHAIGVNPIVFLIPYYRTLAYEGDDCIFAQVCATVTTPVLDTF